MATKTLNIRMDDNDYKFLASFAHEEREDISKAVRELVERGRVMFAIEKYRRSEASIGKAAEIAGVSISKLIEIFKEHGVEANLEYEDYLRGLNNIRKIW